MNNGLYNVDILLLTEMKCNQLLVKETFFFTIYCLKRQLVVSLFPHITFLVTVIVACVYALYRTEGCHLAKSRVLLQLQDCLTVNCHKSTIV